MRHEVTSNTGSDENRCLALHWLHDCMSNHKECNHSKTHQDWMPTRLLDLESLQTAPDTIRLVESTSILSGHELPNFKPLLGP